MPHTGNPAYHDHDPRRLEDRFRALESEHAEASRRVSELSLENRRYADRLAAAEDQNTQLISLYTAAQRLHASPDRREVLDAIQEIVINLIGSEELAIYERRPELADGLRLLASFGLSEELLAEVAHEDGILVRTARSGECFVSDEAGGGPHGLTACVPLKLGPEVTGVILIFSLLPQKAGLLPLDRELFDLLAHHAGAALYLAELLNRRAQIPKRVTT